jgi:uncharacterized membrane protein YkoI
MKAITPILMLSFACFAMSSSHAAPAKTTTHKAHSTTAMHPKLTLASAQAIAQAKVPGGKVKSHELENENGHLIYSFDFVVAGKSGIDEVNVDAMNGTVLAVAHEGPKAERKELAKEKKEAQAAGH